MSQMTNNPMQPQGPSQSLGDRASTTATTAKDEAGSVAETAKSQLGEVASATGEQAKAVVDDAKYQARRVVDQSRSQLRDQASEQKTKLAGTVRDVSQQLRSVTQGGPAPQGVVADLADQAAGMTSRLAEQLDNRSPEELVDEVRRFARRRPGMFLLGALGAGFVAGRLVRSVDTQSLVEAAKSGADVGNGNGEALAQPTGQLGATAPMPAMSPPAPTGASQPAGGFPSDLSAAVRP
jgi:hypothetical protein